VSTNLDESVQRRELDLALRQSELNKRERELGQTIEAVETQRQRLEEVRTEYETRLESLTKRSGELDVEWARVREEEARVVARALELGAAPGAPRAEPATVNVEYETALDERSRELDAEWARLHEEEARLEARSLELEAAAAAPEPGPDSREYETRLEALDERSRELEAEWARLHEEAARLEARSLELEAAAAPPAEQTPAPIILEYQTRLEALDERSRELEAESARLRAEEARLAARSMELDAAAAASRAEPAPVSMAPQPEREPVGAEPLPEPVAVAVAIEEPAPRAARSLIDDWWAKALGAPLEAA
jgi:DNA repair exonuclease SbcCD ATPase subunit